MSTTLKRYMQNDMKTDACNDGDGHRHDGALRSPRTATFDRVSRHGGEEYRLHVVAGV